MIVTSRVGRCNKRAIMTRGDRQARTKEQGGMRDLFSIAVEGMEGAVKSDMWNAGDEQDNSGKYDTLCAKQG